MRILYLLNQRLPTEKAYGIQVAKTCEAMADLGWALTLVCPFRISKIKSDFFQYYGIKRNFVFKKIFIPDFYLPGFLNKIAFSIKSFYSAVILVFYALVRGADFFYTRDELVAYILSFFRKNIIFEGHRFSDKRKMFYARFKKNDLKIVVISQGLKDDFTKFGIKEFNLLVARDGVDLAEFSLTVSKIDSRKKFFSNFHHEAYAHKKLAVYIGHLYSWKGVSEIAKYLCDKNVNYLICIFGGTDKDISKLQEKLKNILKKTHPNLVPMIYLEGRVLHKEVPYILKAADCAILTGNESEIISSRYTSPLKMFEYMASGCPIVAQDLPSFREILNDENSFLVEPGDAKALVDKIAWVFDDDNAEIVKEKAVKALEDVQKYTWQNRATNVLNFLR